MNIIDLAGNLVIQVQLEKKERYDTCGCPSCQRRAKDIEVWLNPNKVVDVPAGIYDEIYETHTEAHHQDQSIAAVSTPQVWLCHSCVRTVSSTSGHCPNCGTKGL